MWYVRWGGAVVGMGMGMGTVRAVTLSAAMDSTKGVVVAVMIGNEEGLKARRDANRP